MAEPDQRTKVMVAIPTLGVGGAEMDLIRNLPRIDRARFRIIVCAFLARGPLAAALTDAGIEVVGPLQPRPRKWRVWLAAAKPRTRLRAAIRPFGELLVRHAQNMPRPLRRAGSRAQAIVLRAGRKTNAALRSWRFALGFIALPALPVLGQTARAYLRFANGVAEHIRGANIDVVHTILPNSYAVGAIACLMTRRPLVMSRVSLNWYQQQSPAFGAIERQVFHRVAAAMICNSSAIRDELVAEGVPLSRIEHIPNGISLDMFSQLGLSRAQARGRLKISEEALVLTLVANHFPYKGHPDLLRALHLIRDRLPPGWLLLAPGRDITGNLAQNQRLAEELGLADHVQFLGERDDVAAILLAADIHVSASHTEGFPNNILEAMCAGLPVIATDVGGVSELVAKDETGLLVPVRDAKAMAGALLQLAGDAQRRRALGAAGRSRVVAQFSLERSVAALERTYARLASRADPARSG
jgi:glycosyltransferase involved in cell wall biosynthesis